MTCIMWEDYKDQFGAGDIGDVNEFSSLLFWNFQKKSGSRLIKLNNTLGLRRFQSIRT